jgi:hypothetical protein
MFSAGTGSSVPAGTVCTMSDVACRTDILLLRRNAATGHWCGPSTGPDSANPCLRAPFLVDRRFIANSDAPSLREDHNLPAGAFYAYGQTSIYWMDFRPSVDTDSSYYYCRQLVRFQIGPIDRVLGPNELCGWPTSAGLPLTYWASGRAYGDVDFMAVAPLHAHSFHLFRRTPPAITEVVTILSSPRDPPR